MRRWKTFCFLFLAVAAIDGLSKLYIHLFFPDFFNFSVFHNFFGIDFSIEHVKNRGAAWGMFSSFQSILVGLRIVVVTALLIYLLFFNRKLFRQWPLTLLLSGAICNVADYFFYGHVIDMFHFTFWGWSFPVFNVADSAITCGIGWLFFHSLFSRPDEHAYN